MAKPQKMIKVKVLRSSVASGQVINAGEVTEVSERDFKILYGLGKVETYEAWKAAHPEEEDEEPAQRPGPAKQPAGPSLEERRAKPISGLHLTEGPLRALQAAKLTTFGALADYVNAGEELIDLDGIGEASAGTILAALIDPDLVND